MENVDEIGRVVCEASRENTWYRQRWLEEKIVNGNQETKKGVLNILRVEYWDPR